MNEVVDITCFQRGEKLMEDLGANLNKISLRTVLFERKKKT